MRVVLQKDLERLEQWFSKNSMKFNKDKSKILHLRQNNQRAQYRIGSVWLVSSLAEMHFGVLVNNKLAMSALLQQ